MGPVPNTNSMWFLLRCPLRVFWILMENALGLVVYVSALIIFRPILYFAPRLYWKIDEHFVWMCMHYVSYWMHSAVGKVLVSGDDLEPFTSQPCLVVVNHQSDADPLILLVSLRRWQSLYGRLSVVLEDIFRCTHFGLMMRLRGDFFVHQGREMRHLQSQLLEEHMKQYERLRDPRWCILFPEGGFLEKRKDVNAKYAKKNGYPLLNNVLLPRLGALRALMNVNSDSVPVNHIEVSNGDSVHFREQRPYFRHLIDVTIAYPQRTPVTLRSMLFALSPASQVAVHFRVRNLDHLSAGCDEEQLRPFVYDLWMEKDNLLQTYYDTGSFPGCKSEVSLQIDYLFYLVSYAISIPVLIKLYCECIPAFVTCFLSIGASLLCRLVPISCLID